MKLNVNFEHNEETGRQRAVISDDRGERMPGVISVEVRCLLRESPQIIITLVATPNSGVTLGAPTSGE